MLVLLSIEYPELKEALAKAKKVMSETTSGADSIAYLILAT